MKLKEWIKKRKQPYIEKTIGELRELRKKSRSWFLIDSVLFFMFLMILILVLMLLIEVMNHVAGEQMTNQIIYIAILGVGFIVFVSTYMIKQYIDMLSDVENKRYIDLLIFLKENLNQR